MWVSIATVVGAGIVLAVAGGAATAHATPAGCGPLLFEDGLAGATVGAQSGGTLDASGFRAAGSDPPGTIVWAIDPPLREGCVEVTISGVTTAGVGEHDLLELFTGPDGAFTDGATDHFLLYKIAGDVFPEYEGRLKVEMGEENSAIEVGTWSANLAWAPGETHTLAARRGGGADDPGARAGPAASRVTTTHPLASVRPCRVRGWSMIAA